MMAKLTMAGLLLALAVAAGVYWYSQPGTKLSETDTILNRDFANAAGAPTIDGTPPDTLAVSLAQSPSLNIISVEKVGEALRSLGRPVETLVTREVTPKLGRRLRPAVQ